MSVQNWAGQTIDVDSIVWRGARDGNTSSFKIGRVIDVNPDKHIARVEWLFEPGTFWMVENYVPRHFWQGLLRVSKISSKGSPSVDTLTVVDVDLEELGEHAARWSELRHEAVRIRDNS